MINTYEAHFYETSKELSTEAAKKHGYPVPKVYGVYTPSQIAENIEVEYPCIVKPDCGGRTSFTFIVHSGPELSEKKDSIPDILFIAEEYIRPAYGYVTRIEVIDRECRLALKRSVTKEGLSAYHLGSEYEIYKELPEEIERTAIGAMDLLNIEAGSMDIIENETGYYIIDVNSVSNASEDNTEMFGFDLMKETAAYAVKRHNELL